MEAIDKFLEDAEKKSPFLRFKDGEPIVGIFKGSKIVDDRFSTGEKTMEYAVEVEGVAKTFNSKSQNLARLMKPIEKDDVIEIVRTGTGFDTQWYVKKKD